MPNSKNELRLLRHATLVLRIDEVNFLIDPMLSPKDTLDPVPNAANDRRIPMVELPLNDGELRVLLDKIDVVVVTHTHRDHWDAYAQQILDKSIPVICQPVDEEQIKSQGFQHVIPVIEEVDLKGIQITRTPGHHGTGEIEKKMGTVSGFILQSGKETIYVAGDTIWCPEVRESLLHYKPDITVVNTGSAMFLTGGPITMTDEDVIMVCKTLPSARVVAVHMETVNHCALTRAALRSNLDKAGITDQVSIPADGESFSI